MATSNGWPCVSRPARVKLIPLASPQNARNRKAGSTALAVAFGETKLPAPAISARQSGPRILPTPFEA